MPDFVEAIYVRGVRTSRFLASVDAFLGVNGFLRGETRSAQTLRVRRDGAWLGLVDAVEHASDAWAEHLSHHLGRSVLQVVLDFENDAAELVRYRHGRRRASVSLADRETLLDGTVRVPADALRPWLPVPRPVSIVLTASGSVGPTGDTEIDALLQDFDDGDESPPRITPGPWELAEALAVIGLKRPFRERSERAPGDLTLRFVRAAHARRESAPRRMPAP